MILDIKFIKKNLKLLIIVWVVNLFLINILTYFYINLKNNNVLINFEVFDTNQINLVYKEAIPLFDPNLVGIFMSKKKDILSHDCDFTTLNNKTINFKCYNIKVEKEQQNKINFLVSVFDEALSILNEEVIKLKNEIALTKQNYIITYPIYNYSVKSTSANNKSIRYILYTIANLLSVILSFFITITILIIRKFIK